MSLVRLQVLVVANPANTNALILKENAPKVKDENITCMTRLDHNRALGQVSPPYSLFLKIVQYIKWETLGRCKRDAEPGQPAPPASLAVWLQPAALIDWLGHLQGAAADELKVKFVSGH